MRRLPMMRSMELSDDEKLDHMALAPPERKPGPEYPYGLRISLTEREFEKLDLDHSVAEVGGMVHMHAMGRITSVSSREDGDGNKCCCVEIQIEDMEIESEEEENEENEEEE